MNVLHFGHTIVRLDLVDSTNNYAANWLNRSIVAEGTVILARSQSQGKGQRGNTWTSEEGQNLTFSVILYPTFLPLEKAHLLTHAAALAVRAATDAVCGACTVKWPNDVYCGKRKMAGILVENTIQENKIKHTIAGIGLNVNQTHFPEGLNATSLKLETGKTIEKEEILKQVLIQLEKYYVMLAQGRYDDLHRDYLHHLYMLNVETRFMMKGSVITGKITGVNANGKLVVLTENGELEADFKEISFQN